MREDDNDGCRRRVRSPILVPVSDAAHEAGVLPEMERQTVGTALRQSGGADESEESPRTCESRLCLCDYVCLSSYVSQSVC